MPKPKLLEVFLDFDFTWLSLSKIGNSIAIDIVSFTFILQNLQIKSSTWLPALAIGVMINFFCNPAKQRQIYHLIFCGTNNQLFVHFVELFNNLSSLFYKYIFMDTIFYYLVINKTSLHSIIFVLAFSRDKGWGLQYSWLYWRMFPTHILLQPLHRQWKYSHHIYHLQ